MRVCYGDIFRRLTKKFNWVHYTPNILIAGRITHMDIEEEDEDNKALLVKKQLEIDGLVPRLRPINEDQGNFIILKLLNNI